MYADLLSEVYSVFYDISIVCVVITVTYVKVTDMPWSQTDKLCTGYHIGLHYLALKKTGL